MPADTDGSVPEQRILEQSLLLPAGGAVTGWAALRLLGGNFFDGLAPDGQTVLPVPLILPPLLHRAPRRGVAWSRDRLDPAERTTVLRIPITVAERATFDAMRAAESAREATVVLDMACAAEITSRRRMRRYIDGHGGWEGVGQARTGLDRADENSRSPNETRLRDIWVVDARLSRPLVNQPVFDRAGRLLGYPDLLDPTTGHVGEFDGADHRAAARQSDDADREGAFRRHGLEVSRVTGADMPRPDRPDVDRIVRRLLTGHALATRLPRAPQTWTLDPPSWFIPDPSLDEILDLRDFQRDNFARWEREGDPSVAELISL